MPALASPNRRLLCLPQHSFALAEYLGRTDAIQATLAATGDEDTSGAAAGQYRGQRGWQATQGILCLRYPPPPLSSVDQFGHALEGLGRHQVAQRKAAGINLPRPPGNAATGIW